MTTSHADPLLRAFSSEIPGPPEPPGPRVNQWPGRIQQVLPGAERVPVLSMIRTVFWGPELHPDPVTGRPGTIRRRAVPSAGACYPVQVHLVCGAGCDVPPGRYAFDAEQGILLRRSGPPGGAAGRGAVVVFTVLPQRTAARYHHRALPLLLSDTAYAVAALAHHAAWHGVTAAQVGSDPGTLAALADLPGYGEWKERWPATGPELALAAVSLEGFLPGVATPSAGPGPLPVPERRPRLLPEVVAWAAAHRPAPAVLPYQGLPGAGPAALRARRSAALDAVSPDDGDAAAEAAVSAVRDLLTTARRTLPGPQPAGCRITLLNRTDDIGRAALQDPGLAERAAGQRWLSTLDGLVLFEADGVPDARDVWWAAELAAHVLYSSLADGPEGASPRLDFRPVSGWTGGVPGRPTLHGLGFRGQGFRTQGAGPQGNRTQNNRTQGAGR